MRSQASRGAESTHTTVPEAEAALGPLGILGDWRQMGEGREECPRPAPWEWYSRGVGGTVQPFRAGKEAQDS